MTVTLRSSYNTEFVKACEHLEKTTLDAIKAKQKDLFEQYTKLETEYQRTMREAVTGDDEVVQKFVEQRKITVQKIKKEQEALVAQKNDLSTIANRMKSAQNFELRQLAEEAREKVGEVSLKTIGIGPLRFRTGEKVEVKGFKKISTSLAVYDHKIKSLNEVHVKMLAKEQGKIHKSSPALEKDVQKIDKLKTAFVDPKKALEAARAADNIIKEAKFLEDTSNEFIAELATSLTRLVAPRAIPSSYIAAKAEKVLGECEKKYRKLEEKYLGKLHEKGEPKKFRQEAYQLANDFRKEIDRLAQEEVKRSAILPIMQGRSKEHTGTLQSLIDECKAKIKEFKEYFKNGLSKTEGDKLRLAENRKKYAQGGLDFLAEYQKALKGNDQASLKEIRGKLQGAADIKFVKLAFPALAKFISKELHPARIQKVESSDTARKDLNGKIEEQRQILKDILSIANKDIENFDDLKQKRAKELAGFEQAKGKAEEVKAKFNEGASAEALKQMNTSEFEEFVIDEDANLLGAEVAVVAALEKAGIETPTTKKIRKIELQRNEDILSEVLG